MPARLVERRIGLMFALFLVLLALATLRAGYFRLQGRLAEEAGGNPADRGPVGARQAGDDRRPPRIALAISADASTVFATPFQVTDPVATARKIAPLLGQPAEDVAAKLSDRRVGFVYLARKLRIWQGMKIEKLKLPGIGVTDDVRRDYPDGQLASQLLGTVGVDNDALSGSSWFERHSQGNRREGTRREGRARRSDRVRSREAAESGPRRHARARQLAPGSHRESWPILAGRTAPRARPRSSTNPRNGEVLAMANWPPVNANDVGASPMWARVNRGVGMTYEPGSTYKVVTVAGALEDRLVRPDTAFTLPAQIQVADRVIKEAHAGGNGVLTVSQILARSSNVGAVRIGLRMGEESFRPVGEALRLRRAYGRSPAGRVGGNRAAREPVLRLVARQPADRSGLGGHAAPDGGGVRGGGERGHPRSSHGSF